MVINVKITYVLLCYVHTRTVAYLVRWPHCIDFVFVFVFRRENHSSVTCCVRCSIILKSGLVEDDSNLYKLANKFFLKSHQ